MADVYKVGVSIMLTSNMSALLGVMAKQLTGINSQVKNLATTWGRSATIIKGAMAAVVGVEVIKGYAKLVQHGEKLIHYQTQLRAAGYSNLEIQEATNRAFQTGSDILTSRYADNLRDIHHLASITGNLNEAIGLSAPFAAVKQVMASLKDDQMRSKFAGDELQTYDLARSLEVMGHTTQGPAVITKWTEAMTASMIAMRGLVDGHSFYNTLNNTGGAGMGYSMDFVTKVLPFLIQEMKSGAGNALYMLSRGFGQGVITKGAAEGLQKYGLIKGPQDYLTDDSKRFLGLRAGSVAGSDVLASDPNKWVDDFLMPALKSHGVDTSNRQAVMAAIGEVSRNKNLTRVLNTMALQHDQIAKEIGNVNRVLESGGAEFLKTDPSIIKKSFFAQLDNLWTILGSQQVAPAYEGLARLTNVIRDMARALTQMQPETLRNLGYGIGILGVSLAGAGGAAILAALGPAGWVVGAVIGIGAALAAFPALRSALVAIPTAINSAVDGAINAINATATRISDAIINFAKSIAGAFHIPGGGRGDAGTQEFGRALGNAGAAPMRYVPPPGGSRGGVIHVHNYLDGKKLGGGLVRTVVRDASGPLQGATSYDYTGGAGGNDVRMV